MGLVNIKAVFVDLGAISAVSRCGSVFADYRLV